MQPEDIIQQKEWKDLSSWEKELLKPLVSGEEEFIHLKNILISALEEEEMIPAIHISVHQYLQNELAKKKSKRVDGFYFYAAASVVITLVASWYIFIFKNNKNNEIALSGNSIHGKIFHSVDNAIKNQLTATVALPKLATTRATLIKPYKMALNKKTVAEKNNLKENIDVTVNTLINKNDDLLAVVTEVY